MLGIISVDGELAVDAVVEGDERLGGCDAVYHLDFVMEYFHKMFVVTGIQFDEHRIRARGIVTFNHFGNFFKFGDNIAIHSPTNEVNANIGTCVITNCFWADIVAGAGDDAHIDHSLDTLMDGCTRDTATQGNIFGGGTGVVNKDAENLTV